MADSLGLLIERLKTALKPYGARSKFCRETGIDRSVLEKWLAGQTTPSIENIDKIAKGLGVQPWELLRDAGATLGEIAASKPGSHLKELPMAGLAELIDQLEKLDQGHAAQYIQIFRDILDPELRKRALQKDDLLKKGAKGKSD